MTLPKTGGRGAAVVMVAFDPAAPGVFTNWCAAKNFKMSVANEIISEKVGHCDDWDAPIATIKEYGGQDVTASMDATWSPDTHKKTSDWALLQRKLPVRIHFPLALIGQREYYDGIGMLSSLDLDGIGNVDGAKISESIAIEFDGGITPTDKA